MSFTRIRGQKFQSSARNYEWNLARTSNSSQSTRPVGQVQYWNIQKIYICYYPKRNYLIFCLIIKGTTKYLFNKWISKFNYHFVGYEMLTFNGYSAFNETIFYRQISSLDIYCGIVYVNTMGEVFRIIPEFRILWLTFHRSTSKWWIRENEKSQ